ncbi:MAG TPA: hypothetical protein VLX92_05635 [Kofleriaceae bacterium]|nr:hypothetical protein [Kofleriaceae bacterium]
MQRKSRPQIAPNLRVIPTVVDRTGDVTLVDAPIAARFPERTHQHRPPVAARPLAAPDIIPFARPRAIAALPATFAPVAPMPAPPPPPTVALSVPVVVPPPPVSVPPAPPPPVAAPPPRSRWAAFEKLGLVAPRLSRAQLSRHVVTLYRMIGFGILTIIVCVLIGYIATTTFFYLSDSWVVPTVISPTDEKVVELDAQLAERRNNRDKLASDLDDAQRALAVQQAFQAEFAKAIQSDLDDRRAALARMEQLATAAASTRRSIRASNNAFASASQRRMAQEYQAGLIDRQTMLSGKFQLAQISSSNLSLAERQAEYETRAVDLEAQVRSLEALLAGTASDAPLSYDVLKIKQEYETSKLEAQKAAETRDTLQAAVAREDKLLDALEHTSYLKALADHAQVAFVPYENLKSIENGSSLYACKLGMVFCHQVGVVLEVLPGEVLFKHPHRDKMLRGQMVELRLDDRAAATDDVLFVGGRPLLI